jgi:hypothetical protein
MIRIDHFDYLFSIQVKNYGDLYVFSKLSYLSNQLKGPYLRSRHLSCQFSRSDSNIIGLDSTDCSAHILKDLRPYSFDSRLPTTPLTVWLYE